MLLQRWEQPRSPPPTKDSCQQTVQLIQQGRMNAASAAPPLQQQQGGRLSTAAPSLSHH